MLKQFDEYQLDILASVDDGIAAQILCSQDGRFVGRIDFHTDDSPPDSYLWHPTGTDEPDLIYLVLKMPMARFHAVSDLLREEGPFGLELWPLGRMLGPATTGYAGALRSLQREPVGEAEEARRRAPRPP